MIGYNRGKGLINNQQGDARGTPTGMGTIKGKQGG